MGLNDQKSFLSFGNYGIRISYNWESGQLHFLEDEPSFFEDEPSAAKLQQNEYATELNRKRKRLFKLLHKKQRNDW